MAHKFPLGSFHRENGTTFSEIPFIPENFQWAEPKSRVPFTSTPEFLEFFGKWKTPINSNFFDWLLENKEILNEGLNGVNRLATRSEK